MDQKLYELFVGVAGNQFDGTIGAKFPVYAHVNKTQKRKICFIHFKFRKLAEISV